MIGGYAMKLIDADALERKLFGASWFDNRDEDVAWNILNYAPTVDAVRAGWISIDDRLPQPTEAVLIHLSNFGIEVDCMEYSECGELAWCGSNKRAHWDKVTHWMALPPDPKMENIEGDREK